MEPTRKLKISILILYQITHESGKKSNEVYKIASGTVVTSNRFGK